MLCELWFITVIFVKHANSPLTDLCKYFYIMVYYILLLYCSVLLYTIFLFLYKMLIVIYKISFITYSKVTTSIFKNTNLCYTTQWKMRKASKIKFGHITLKASALNTSSLWHFSTSTCFLLTSQGLCIHNHSLGKGSLQSEQSYFSKNYWDMSQTIMIAIIPTLVL